MMAGKGITIGRVALEHRKHQRLHIVYPDCFADSVVGFEVHRQPTAPLSRLFWHRPGRHRRQSVRKANGLRLLGSFKYPSQKDAAGRDVKSVRKAGKEYHVCELDQTGGFYVACSPDTEHAAHRLKDR